MADSAPGRLPPELLQTIAEAVVTALTKQQQPDAAVQGLPIEQSEQPQQPAQVEQTDTPKPPVPSGEIGKLQVQDMITPMPVPTWIRPKHRLASRKFWVAVGTVATLIAQKPVGLDLSPAALVAVAAVAAIYVAAQAIVDSAQKEGRDA